MTVTIESEAEIMQEVTELLLQKMSPAKVARFGQAGKLVKAII